MQRISTSSLPACPTLFTPLQMHARELLRLGSVSWVGWMRDHTISLQRMIEQHRYAVVVAGASLYYSGKRLFPDGDTIDVETTSSVHRRGVLMEGVSRFKTDGREFARMHLYLRPVAIGDEISAAAKSSNLHPAVQVMFDSDEVRPNAYPRVGRKLASTLEAEGTLLAEGQHAFRLHRYAMDFADQWAFMEASAFTSGSREELALAHTETQPRLVEALAQPVQEFHIDLTRPYFVFDSGHVASRAFLWNDDLYFLHQLVQVHMGDEQVHATVVERIARSLH